MTSRQVGTRVLVVDNEDSYTHNLAALVGTLLGAPADVTDHRAVDVGRIAAYSHVIVGPGPGHPGLAADVARSADAVRECLRLRVPLLGVCLGHQLLAQVRGGSVERRPPAHGVVSVVRHTGAGPFAGLPQGFRAVRYHSLAVTTVPASLQAVAWAEDDAVMGLAAADAPAWGVQFHPESVLSEHGAELLAAFLGAAGSPDPVAPPGPGAGTAGRTRDDSVGARLLDGWRDPATVHAAWYAHEPRAVWLDGESGSTWSYLAAARESVTYDVSSATLTRRREGGPVETAAGPLLDWLADRQGPRRAELPCPFVGGWVGYLGYEVGTETEGASTHRSPTPDACLLRVDDFLAFDHATERVYAVGRPAWLAEAAARWAAESGDPPVPSRPEPPEVVADWDRCRYAEAYTRVQEQLHAGNTYEVNLTYRIGLRFGTPPDAGGLFRQLRHRNPVPYAALLRHGDLAVLSCSPECFLRVDAAAGTVLARPIKGTTARAADPADDARQRDLLAGHPKFVRENLMITDLLRNDLNRVCAAGTVRADPLMAVESYRAVHQLVTTVRGQLPYGAGVVDCLRAAFPPGSMTGAPKHRTTQVIDDVEDDARGPYAGVLGWIGDDGSADLAVVIRTLVVQGRDGWIGTGGGVVVGSTAAEEYAETRQKVRPLLAALGVLSGPAGSTRGWSPHAAENVLASDLAGESAFYGVPRQDPARPDRHRTAMDT